MSKYIVRNCTSYLFHDICSQAGEYDVICSNCTDCLIKRVIDRCKNMKAEFDDEIKNGNYIAKFKWFKSGRNDAGKEILAMFEIEDVKE